ncbi:MAG: ATP-binding cassette domain-containing protein [Planctomycetota bacterium]|jgi:ATP-binding cassette subfamily F protein 3|nr:ATP-binding cassette domain-containing protein [Planctomycetota bacterium]
MPPLFDLNHLELHLGGKVIFDDISYAFTDERKFALIGRNGAGKSTLCRVIRGEEELDAGAVYRHAALRLGFLRQDENFLPAESVADYLQRDSGAEKWRCAELAHKFALTAELVEQPVAALSGGWRMRVKLVALLLHEPNFLLLDEPTNFLDLRTQLLLQKFLLDFRGGALVVSHDRAFLDATCPHTLELSRGQLTYSPLPVSEHLRKQRDAVEHDRRANVAKAAKMKQLQRFIDKNRAGANTAAQAKNKQKQLDRIELAVVETAENRAKIRLPLVERQRKTVLNCEELAIGYVAPLAKKINFTLEPGERLLVAGDNGQGKTTLLKTLTGALPPLAGKVQWGYNCAAGVYAQHVYSALPPELTAREFLQRRNRRNLNDKEVANIAGGFLFRGGEIDKAIKVLSGGERARLCLAGLFLTGDNVLALDEPSNHLDFETASALAEALGEYQGAVIFVSHERSFAAQVATGVLEIKDGRARRVNGGFAEYVQELERENAENETAKPARLPARNAAADLTGKERFALTKRSGVLERKIEKLTAQIAAQVEELHSAAGDWAKSAALGRELDAARGEKDALEEEWLKINAPL